MTDSAASVPPLDERVRDLKLIERALAHAVRVALQRHKQAGNPVVAWRDGRIIWIRPEDIELPSEDVSLKGDAMPLSLFHDETALAALCRRYHIRRLSLFGSTLKGTARPDSDIDLLVEFEPDAKPSLLTMARIELELSPLLGGRKVDLRTAQDLSRYFRHEVVRTAQVQYEAG